MTVLAQTLAKSGEAAKSGPIGLAIILILCIACYFLFKSMSKHLRTVREDFPTAAPTSLPADSTDATPTAIVPTEAAAPETERPETERPETERPETERPETERPKAEGAQSTAPHDAQLP